jgi:capsular exopolysaccharide synthesis family protein
MHLVDLRGFFRALVRRWPSITVLTLAGLGVGLAVTSMSTRWYQAGSQIFVSTRATTNITELNEGNSFSQSRVQSYAEIIPSPRIAEAVVDRLGLDLTPGQLSSRISASVEFNTVLIDISVRDTDAVRATQIADAVAVEARQEIVGLETPPGGTSPVTIGITRTADTPTAPVSPKPLLEAAAGLFLGLLAGIGLAVLRDVLDNTVRTGQALADVSGLPVLGTVPYDRTTAQAPVALRPGVPSARSEAYRLVRTNLQFAQVDQHPRVMLVTSAMANEGKTNTAINVALALAEAGHDTCLVDADLRSPSVAGTLGLVQDAGLTTVLIGTAGVDQVFQEACDGKLTVLTSGPIPPNPAEILASERMRGILKDLSGRFDAVVVDSAPLLPVADTLGLAPYTDGTVLVVRAARTSGDRVRSAVDALRAVGAPVLGAMLNMADLKRQGYGRAYGYGYGYGYDSEAPHLVPEDRRAPDLRAQLMDGGAEAVPGSPDDVHVNVRGIPASLEPAE